MPDDPLRAPTPAPTNGPAADPPTPVWKTIGDVASALTASAVYAYLVGGLLYRVLRAHDEARLHAVSESIHGPDLVAEVDARWRDH
jgi:hypothetical protein